jgi:urease accessory protein UreF
VLGAALRLLPFTHSQAQAILHRLHPLIARETRRIGRRHWRNMASFAPELDLVAIGHETDDLRQFAS